MYLMYMGAQTSGINCEVFKYAKNANCEKCMKPHIVAISGSETVKSLIEKLEEKYGKILTASDDFKMDLIYPVQSSAFLGSVLDGWSRLSISVPNQTDVIQVA